MKHAPNAYAMVKAWHADTGSYGDYITALQRKAAEQGQPVDVLYEGWDGTWVRLGVLPEGHSFRTRHPEFKEVP